MRPILPKERLHPAIAPKIANKHELIDTVEEAIASNKVVVVGMAQNPHCRTVRKHLEAANIPFKYLEYGSYLGQWRRRNTLKMWTGWPTFPMVFVDGVLVGGSSDVVSLLENGELTA